MLRWSWLAAMQITTQEVPDVERWSVIGGDLEITPLLLAACASLYLMELSPKPVGSKVKNTVVHQKKNFHALDILLLMWKCCLVLIELPLQQHSHKFLKQAKKGCGIHWNWLRPNEKQNGWVGSLSGYLGDRAAVCFSLGSAEPFYSIYQLQFLKTSLRSAQTPRGNLCCLCNFEHNIWCLPKLASHRRSLFQSKPSVWRLIFRNPIKEALFKVLASPGEVMIPAMKSVGRTMGKTKSP